MWVFCSVTILRSRRSATEWRGDDTGFFRVAHGPAIGSRGLPLEIGWRYSALPPMPRALALLLLPLLLIQAGEV
jgi:hypothetical protein